MQEVERYVHAHQERFLEELAAACRIPSIFDQPAALQEMAAWVGERLERLGCQVQFWPVNGGPAIVWGEVGAGERSLLSYSHYDVQPVDPVHLWHTPPFEASLRDGRVYARGVADDKGDLMARIHAVETYRSVYGELPVRFKFFVEGEEEIGSPHLVPVAVARAAELRADACLWESGEFDHEERYRVFLGVKGLQYLELRVRTANTDLHSAYASFVPNPAWRLVQALNTLKAPDDSILIDGFQNHVRPLTALEAAYLDRIPFQGEGMKRQWGLQRFINGIDDRQALERFLYGPTCNICGLYSGYIETGVKTVLPATAMAKLDFRLVPDVTPELVVELLRAHLDRRGFTDVEVAPLSAMFTSRSDPEADIVDVVTAAAAAVYGQEPVVYPSHCGSGPMYPLAQGLGTPAVTVGVGYSGSNIHAPNENIRLADYLQHIRFLVELIRRFAEQR